MSVWRDITSLGDSALLLPMIAWMAICLLASRDSRHDGLRWVLAAVVCGGGVMLSKLLFMAWGVGPPGLDYTGFSGHTALAVLVWPSLAGMFARGAGPRQRLAMLAAGTLVGAAVAVSRLALKVHSPSEVWMGAILGAAVAAWFLHGLVRAPVAAPRVAARRLAVLAAGAVIVGFACYGRVFPSQHLLQDIALWLSGHRDVFTRPRRLG